MILKDRSWGVFYQSNPGFKSFSFGMGEMQGCFWEYHVHDTEQKLRD